MKAWYFSTKEKRLRYGDNRVIRKGLTHKARHTQPVAWPFPVLCCYGVHGSVNIIDALQYAPGPYVWRVNIAGDLNRGHDKLAGRYRQYLWGFDATAILHEFIMWCNAQVIRSENRRLCAMILYDECANFRVETRAYRAAWRVAHNGDYNGEKKELAKLTRKLTNMINTEAKKRGLR